MNIYVVISDDGIETYSQKGLILYANKKLFAKDPFYENECKNVKGIRTVKEAKAYFETNGASVTHTELIRG